MIRIMSKQVLDVQQMQHLQKIGLKLEQSLVHYYRLRKVENAEWHLVNTVGDISSDNEKYEYIPAYTLQDVLDALPRFVIDEEGYKYYLQIEMMNTEFDDWRISYKSVGQDESSLGYFQAFQLIDAAVRMLVLCYENGYVETNKNE